MSEPTRPLCSEEGLPVTAFIKTVNQPRGGFLNPKRFRTVDHDDNAYLGPDEENIHPIIMGIVVDSLTRWRLTGCDTVDAFIISITGAGMIRQYDQAMDLIRQLEDGLGDAGQLTPSAVRAACQLSGYDVCYRAGPAHYKDVENIQPDMITVDHIITLVNRAVNFFDSVGVIDCGMTFKGGYTRRVIKGDADYLSANALWDMKVSVIPPTKNHTLQLLIYHVLAGRSDDYRDQVIDRIGIFNPRYNRVWLFDMKDFNEFEYRDIVRLVCG